MSQMFGRDSRSPNPFQGGNNYGGSYNSGGGYNSYNSQKLGSYRVSQYDSTRISHGLSSVSPNWKEFTPMSINLRE